MAALGLQTVTDRETLAEALNGPQSSWNPGNPLIIAAARQRLAQLPETCERCNGAGYADDGSGRIDRYEESCRGCNGTGTVYPQEAIDQAFAIIKSLTNPRYVVYSEWQLGGAAIHEQDEDDRLQWL